MQLAELNEPSGNPRQCVTVLYHRYYARMVGLAESILGDRAEAVDAVQDAFVSVLRHRERAESIDHPYPWLCRIVTSRSIDRVRRRKAAQGARIDPAFGARAHASTPVAFSPDRALEMRQIGEAISHALEKLSADHRSVVAMRELAGMSYDEIARRSGVPRGTVMSRLFYARRHLRCVLGKHAAQTLTVA